MIDTQHLIRIQLNYEQKWAKVVGIREEGKLVEMQTEHSETFLMKTEGQDITSGYHNPPRGHSTYLPHPSLDITTKSQTAYMA